MMTSQLGYRTQKPGGVKYLLAIDPGSTATGAALFKGHELLDVWSRSAPKEGRVRRSYLIITELNDWVWRKVPKSGLLDVVYEDTSVFVFGGKVVQVVELQRFIGMLEYWAETTDRVNTIQGYNVGKIKAALTGKSAATKETIEAAMRYLYDLLDVKYPSHVWDALAVASYYFLEVEGQNGGQN